MVMIGLFTSTLCFAQRYTVTEIGRYGSNIGDIYRINGGVDLDNGVMMVIGVMVAPSALSLTGKANQAFIWFLGDDAIYPLEQILEDGEEFRSSEALDVNRRGVVVGTFRSVTNRSYAAIWSPPDYRARLVTPRERHDARGINDEGFIAGRGPNEQGNFKPYLMDPDPEGDITYFGESRLNPVEMNDLNQIVGNGLLLPNGESHAFLWEPGANPVDLGTLGGMSLASAINYLGVVVGQSHQQAIIKLPDRPMEDLGTPNGFSNPVANDINDRGAIVGSARLSGQIGFESLRGMIFEYREEPQDINNLLDLMPEQEGLILHNLVAISQSGKMVGYGSKQGVRYVYLLTPDEEDLYIRGDCNQDGTMDISDGILILDINYSRTDLFPHFNACDANGDLEVDVSDGIYIFNYLFLGGPEPPPPFPQ